MAILFVSNEENNKHEGVSSQVFDRQHGEDQEKLFRLVHIKSYCLSKIFILKTRVPI